MVVFGEIGTPLNDSHILGNMQAANVFALQRNDMINNMRLSRVPRARGDEPKSKIMRIVKRRCSPRTRG